VRYKTVMLSLSAAMLAPAVGLGASSVSLYGTLNADLESVSANGATVPGASFLPRSRVSSNSSNVGLRGAEDLGNGLAAFFQVESAVNVDAGGGTWASRNSAGGLQGSWGKVFFGQWDTPYKVSTARLDPFGNTTIGAYSAIMGLAGSLTTAQGGSNFQQQATFDRRASNVVQYWTPTIEGISGRIAYGASDASTGRVP
jgi:predicted porin